VKKPDTKLRTLFIVVSMMAVLSSFIGGYLYYSALSKSLKQRAYIEAEERLNELGHNIDSYLEWSLLSIRSLAGIKELRQSVLTGDMDVIAEANIILDQFQEDLKLSVCYLMNGSGNTIASSNRKTSDSFVGKNYGFRPYFTQAMQGIPVVYMALGVTSKKRGLYYSHPVYGTEKANPLGVAVIKAPIELIEKDFMQPRQGIVMLTDPHGVVFVSNRTDWLYHLLWKVSPEKISAIISTRQFGPGPWNWTGMKKMGKDKAVDDLGNEYSIHSQELANYPEWHLVYLHSNEFAEKITAPLRKSVGAVVLVLCGIFGLIVFFLYVKANTSIVQRKEMEERLQGNEDNLNKAQQIAHIGNWNWNIKTNRISGSYEFYQISGLSPPEFDIGFGAYQKCIHPHDLEPLKQLIERALKEKKPYNSEYRIVRPDNDIRIVHEQGEVLLDANGNPVTIFGTIQDITQRKESEDILRQSEEKYRTMIQRSNDMIWTIDKTGKFTFFNEQTEKASGLRLDEWIGKSLIPLTVDEDLPMIKEVFQKSIKGESLQYELRFKKQNQELLTISVNTAPIFKNGKVNEILSFGRDITEQKNSEKEKMRLETHLQQAQKMESIGTLAGGIAHDFNNILSSIFGYSQLAEIHINQPEKAKEYINKLVKGAQRASALIQQILTFSRQSEFEKQPLSVFLYVKEALTLLRSSIPSNIEIKENILSKAKVMADPTQIHQVVMNLCTNAYHAMSDTGGVLTVELQDIEIPEPENNAEINISAGKYIKLQVSDTGHGIDKKNLGRIFDPYFTTKEIGKGTGLGLAVVAGIIEKQNGFIRLFSEVGSGSRFQVFWPRIEQNGSPDVSEKKKTDMFMGTEKIMLVDDEPDILDTLQAILERQGYGITTFKDGASALQSFGEDPDKFDLIITDMTMPRMAGDELSVEVLKIRKDMTIILCTGYSENISEDKARKIGISEYVQKPITAQSLSYLIREVLDKNK